MINRSVVASLTMPGAVMASQPTLRDEMGWLYTYAEWWLGGIVVAIFLFSRWLANRNNRLG